MHIIYCDNHLLVANKPSGLLTQPTEQQKESLESQAKGWVKECYHKPGNVFLHAVHRLDRPASGLVLFARTSKALSRLNTSLRDKIPKKEYVALLENVPSKRKGIMEHTLIHDKWRAQVDPKGKQARLFYEVVETTDKRCLVHILLETGRYHQIRLQFSTIDCPILGDTKYGAILFFAKDAIALHHHKLIIPHPIGGERLTFKAPLPLPWKKYLSPSLHHLLL